MSESRVEELIKRAADCEEAQDYKGMFTAVCEGLKLSPFNYELYLQLGNYYLASEGNAMRAMLCFENAMFYCTNPDDEVVIQGFFDAVYAWAGRKPANVSVVIVSYNSMQIMKDCIESLRLTCNPKTTQIVVVDNASTDGIAQWLSEQNDLVVALNEENLGFGGGSNMGMNLAEADNDIFFLNNDTIMTPNALFWLRMGLYGSDDTGAAGAFSNYPGNDQDVKFPYSSTDDFVSKAIYENVPREVFAHERIWISGFALLVRGDLVRKLGGFDPDYGRGYLEDNDLSMRIEMEGYKLVACDNSVIFHYGCTSFKKDIQKTLELFESNKKLFREKWQGIELNECSTFSVNMVNYLLYRCAAEKLETPRVLDIDCRAGAMLSKIKYSYPSGIYFGITSHELLFKIASLYHNALMGTFPKAAEVFEGGAFDFVICENFDVNNMDSIGQIYRLLKAGGEFVFTLTPNEDINEIPDIVAPPGFEIGKINRVISEGGLVEYYVIVIRKRQEELG